MPPFDESKVASSPRLIIEYKRGHGGGEDFRWGMTGAMPMLRAIGALERVQVALITSLAWDECGEPDLPEDRRCDLSMLVIAWDAERDRFDWWVGRGIPADSLIGMVAVVKELVVTSCVAQQSIIEKPLGGSGQLYRG